MNLISRLPMIMRGLTKKQVVGTRPLSKVWSRFCSSNSQKFEHDVEGTSFLSKVRLLSACSDGTFEFDVDGTRFLSQVRPLFRSSNRNFEFDLGYRYDHIVKYIFVDDDETRAWFSFIKRTLQNSCIDRNQNIERLKLTIWVSEFLADNAEYFVDDLIQTANQGRVKEFVLRLLSDEGWPTVMMPPNVFTMETLQALELQGCEFPPHSYYDDDERDGVDVDVKLPLLRELVLRESAIDENTLEKLISSSPLLTSIKFSDCNIKIDEYSSKLPKIDIKAPNLEEFLIEKYGMKIEIKGQNVEKVLSVSHTFLITDDFQVSIPENLVVQAGYKDLKIEIDAQKLETVLLDDILRCNVTFKIGKHLKEMELKLTSDVLHSKESRTLKLEFDDDNADLESSPNMIKLELLDSSYVLKRYLRCPNNPDEMGASLTHKTDQSFQKGSGPHKLEFLFLHK
ncbi:hypothetical protein ACFE04_031245 [Oxalis oulophora]